MLLGKVKRQPRWQILPVEPCVPGDFLYTGARFLPQSLCSIQARPVGHQFDHTFCFSPGRQDRIETDALSTQLKGQGFGQSDGGGAHTVGQHQVGNWLFDRVGCDGQHTGRRGLAQVGQSSPDQPHMTEQDSSTACCQAASSKSVNLPAGGPPVLVTSRSNPPSR